MFAWFGYDLPIRERLQIIKDAGFDAAALWWGKEICPIQQQAVLARNISLDIDNIHAPFDNPNSLSLWLDGTEGDDYLAVLMRCVADCAELHIPTVVIHLVRQSSYAPLSQIRLDRIAKLVSEAEKSGVNLAFENLKYLDHLDSVLSAFSSERVGFCFDSGHEHMNHPDAHLLRKYSSRLFAVHLDDNLGGDDTHLLPFDGSVNWRDVVLDLAAAKPLPYLTLEVDFNRKHEKAAMYNEMPAVEYVARAYKNAVRI
jgi:sugar phosphate isomerase/epimerase